MMSRLFLAWQDARSRRWYPVGVLTQESGIFCFAYVEGALEAKRRAGFVPLAGFPDFRRVYESAELFPVFHNRVMPASRPDYGLYLEWLGLPASGAWPMVILERSGGSRVTDSLEVFGIPEVPADGRFRSGFFVRGLRHISPEAVKSANDLQAGTVLLARREPENPDDPRAVSVSLVDGEQRLGYLPRFLAHEVAKIWELTGDAPLVRVARTNAPPAPARFRVYCELEMRWPAGYEPLQDPEYRPLAVAELRVA